MKGTILWMTQLQPKTDAHQMVNHRGSLYPDGPLSRQYSLHSVGKTIFLPVTSGFSSSIKGYKTRIYIILTLRMFIIKKISFCKYWCVVNLQPISSPNCPTPTPRGFWHWELLVYFYIGFHVTNDALFECYLKVNIYQMVEHFLPQIDFLFYNVHIC